MSQRQILLIVGISLLLILFAPKLLTSPAWCDWMQIETKDRPLGDTIGGVTAPFLSALGSILLFITIWVQIETNRKQNKDAELARVYESFIHDIDNIRKDVESFPHPNDLHPSGIRGIKKLASHFPSINARDNYSKYIKLESFKYLKSMLWEICHIFKRILDSGLSDEEKYDLRIKLSWLYLGKLENHVSIIGKTLDNDTDKLNVNASELVDCYKTILSNLQKLT